MPALQTAESSSLTSLDSMNKSVVEEKFFKFGWTNLLLEINSPIVLERVHGITVMKKKPAITEKVVEKLSFQKFIIKGTYNKEDRYPPYPPSSLSSSSSPSR